MGKARKQREVPFSCTQCGQWKHVLLPRTWLYTASWDDAIFVVGVPFEIRCGSCYWADESK